MKVKLDIRPDLVAMMAAEIAAGERAVTAAMREAGTGLKLAWRSQIVGAGLGPRLANSIRSEVFPKAGASLNAAAVVWSKAPVIVVHLRMIGADVLLPSTFSVRASAPRLIANPPPPAVLRQIEH
jgi:Family of unknown function (DUF6441)